MHIFLGLNRDHPAIAVEVECFGVFAIDLRVGRDIILLDLIHKSDVRCTARARFQSHYDAMDLFRSVGIHLVGIDIGVMGFQSGGNN